MGSWGSQYYMARWLVERTDQSLFLSGPAHRSDRLLQEAETIKRLSIGQP